VVDLFSDRGSNPRASTEQVQKGPLLEMSSGPFCPLSVSRHCLPAGGDGLRQFDDVRGITKYKLDLKWPTLLAHLEAPASSPPPTPRNITRYELGAAGAIPYTFTDATVRRDTVVYCAAAEASPDATRDGPVTGSALGVIESNGTRWTPIVDPAGAALSCKIEGLTAVNGVEDRVYAVADADDLAAASVLLTIELHGKW
jgi:hypothetical protein